MPFYDKAAPLVGICVAGLVQRPSIATHITESFMQWKFQGICTLKICLILALDTDEVARAEDETRLSARCMRDACTGQNLPWRLLCADTKQLTFLKPSTLRG